MEEKLKEQSLYVVTFLAMMLGLGIFRLDLEQLHLYGFLSGISVFNVGVSMVLALVLAAYIQALVLLVIDNMTIDRVPIRKYMLSASSLLIFAALLSPIAIVFFLTSQATADYILSTVGGTSNTVTTLLIALNTAIFAYLATGLSKARSAHQLAAQATVSLDESTKIIKATINKSSLYDFLQIYEEYDRLARNTAGLYGYSLKFVNLVRVMDILRDKNIFDTDDIVAAKRLVRMRNEYVHAKSKPSSQEIKEAREMLLGFAKKIEAGTAELIEKRSSDLDGEVK